MSENVGRRERCDLAVAHLERESGVQLDAGDRSLATLAAAYALILAERN